MVSPTIYECLTTVEAILLSPSCRNLQCQHVKEVSTIFPPCYV